MELRPILRGLLSLLPIWHAARPKSNRGPGQYWSKNITASYYYGLWLKHVTLLHANGAAFPASIAEFGPGDSLGFGIAARLSGVGSYHAYDIQPFADLARDANLIDVIAGMLRDSAPRPKRGWPDIDCLLSSSLFPSHVLSPDILAASLSAERINELRHAAIGGGGTGPLNFRYIAPWNPQSVPSQAYDLIVTHSVLEYVEDLGEIFRVFSRILRPGGWMSHQIDLKSLGITRKWNGHLAYPHWLWRIVAGNRRHFPNRKMVSDYSNELQRAGFQIISIARSSNADGLRRSSVAKQFWSVTDEDLTCDGLFIIARLNP